MLGLFCLYYMLNDTHFKADHKRVILTEVKQAFISFTVFTLKAGHPLDT